MEVRESKERIDIFDGPRRVASHKRVLEAADTRVMLAEHRPPRHEGVFVRRASVEEQRLTGRAPATKPFIALLRQRGRATARELRWLDRMVEEYPPRALEAALVEATHYGMIDLDRLERMVLRRIARDFFLPRCPLDGQERDDER
jgi:hypothetical protein